jgi:hypothetical protein
MHNLVGRLESVPIDARDSDQLVAAIKNPIPAGVPVSAALG